MSDTSNSKNSLLTGRIEDTESARKVEIPNPKKTKSKFNFRWTPAFLREPEEPPQYIERRMKIKETSNPTDQKLPLREIETKDVNNTEKQQKVNTLENYDVGRVPPNYYPRQQQQQQVNVNLSHQIIQYQPQPMNANLMHNEQYDNYHSYGREYYDGDLNLSRDSAMAWIVCFCCCVPLGLAAIAMVHQAKNALFIGDRETAKRNSRISRILSITGFVIGGVLTVMVLLYYIVFMPRRK